MNSSLPQELLLLITGEFNGDWVRKGYLKSCALVCRDWYTAACVHLFHTIEVDVGHISCRSLHRLLLDSPHLASLVRGLTLRGERERSPNPDYDAELAAALSLMPDIDTLHLLRWQMVHLWTSREVLRDSIVRVLKCPLCATLRITLNSYNPPDVNAHNFLIHAPNLKRLSLTGLTQPTMSFREQLFANTSDYVSRIEELVVGFGYDRGNDQGWLLLHLRSVDFTSLRSLRVLGWDYPNLVTRLLRMSGSSLEHFHLEKEPHDWNLGDGLDLSHNRGLRSLHFEDATNVDSCPDNLDWLWRSVSTLPSITRVKNITVLFNVHSKHPHRPALYDYGGFRELASTLANTSQFPALVEVKIVVYYWYQPLQGFTQQLEREMKDLGRKLVLEARTDY